MTTWHISFSDRNSLRMDDESFLSLVHMRTVLSSESFSALGRILRANAKVVRPAIVKAALRQMGYVA